MVNVSSVAGLMPAATGPDYSACKAALNNLTVSLAEAAASDGVTVCSCRSETPQKCRLKNPQFA